MTEALLGHTVSPLVWVGFILFVIFALSIDTFFLNERYHPQHSLKMALFWSVLWVCCALVFNLILWRYCYVTQGLAAANKIALDFFTGYLLEKSLSVDNLFAFYMIFTQLRIPFSHQHRVFSYGIWGAIIMRLFFILTLGFLVVKYHWIIYVMGVFLVITGTHMLLTIEQEERNLSDSRIMFFLKRVLRVTDLHGQAFVVRIKGLYYITPLFIALIFVELSDLIFAIDSIPAIFAITTDPFIVWSSNIFAILGLRALYFLVVGMVTRLHLLKYGLALILVYIGLKMSLSYWIKIPVGISLLIIVTILSLFIGLSFIQKRR